jgi:hypothetical protein
MDNRVVRVALAARSVAPLPDGTGFANGMAVHLPRWRTVPEPPLKAFEPHAVDQIVVASDGQSLIVVDGDERNVRHLACDGKVLAEPYRARQSETIGGEFFHGDSPKPILRKIGSASTRVSPS